MLPSKSSRYNFTGLLIEGFHLKFVPAFPAIISILPSLLKSFISTTFQSPFVLESPYSSVLFINFKLSSCIKTVIGIQSPTMIMSSFPSELISTHLLSVTIPYLCCSTGVNVLSLLFNKIKL